MFFVVFASLDPFDGAKVQHCRSKIKHDGGTHVGISLQQLCFHASAVAS
jgi:hypothetical protein